MLAVALATLACVACAAEDLGPARPLAYVRPQPWPRLLVEVDAVPGHGPRPATLQRLQDGLQELLDKPLGVEVWLDEGALEPVGAGQAWTVDALRSLAAATFDAAVEPDTIAMHVLFVDGRSADDEGDRRVLGLALDHTHVVLFAEAIREACSSPTLPGKPKPAGRLQEQLCESVEEAVWAHEVGHLLGLVDNGLTMQQPHRDPEHGRHDADEACVMHWQVAGADVTAHIRKRLEAGKTGSLRFCALCRADVQAARGP